MALQLWLRDRVALISSIDICLHALQVLLPQLQVTQVVPGFLGLDLPITVDVHAAEKLFQPPLPLLRRALCILPTRHTDRPKNACQAAHPQTLQCHRIHIILHTPNVNPTAYAVHMQVLYGCWGKGSGLPSHSHSLSHMTKCIFRRYRNIVCGVIST